MLLFLLTPRTYLKGGGERGTVQSRSGPRQTRIAMEQENGIQKTEDKAAADAEQDRRKRLLGAILENHLTIMDFYLKSHIYYIDEYWPFDDFNEREEFIDDLARDVRLSCGHIADLFKWGKWIKEDEAELERKTNSWKNFKFE